MSKTKEIIICVVSIVALMFAIATTVFATEGTPDLMGSFNNSDSGNNATLQDITEKKTNNTNNTNNVSNTSNTNVSNKTNNTNVNKTTIPYTGIDYSVLVIIAVCGVSAVYAYKKIRDYNV